MRRLVIIVAAAIALTGCFDDKPSDKLASDTIRQIANNDLIKGLEISNFQRSNGQVDPGSANRYKVTYSYDLRLVKPYAEVILSQAKELESELAAHKISETKNFFDMNSMVNGLINVQLLMAVNLWVGQQGDGLKTRMNTVLSHCDPCAEYLNGKDKKGHLMAFFAAWMITENLGFKDGAQIGDSVPRIASAFFSKTEKGWQPSD